jgi:hypothetical protein
MQNHTYFFRGAGKEKRPSQDMTGKRRGKARKNAGNIRRRKPTKTGAKSYKTTKNPDCFSQSGKN